MNFGIIGNFYHRLGLVRTLPFMLVLAKLALRIPWVDHRAWRVVEILNTPESLRPERYIDFFKDQEDFLGIKIGWQPINFVGSDIIEFGPGPLAGWAPMALFRGASRVFGIEPNWIPGVLEDSAIEQAYLRPHYSSLVKAFGPIMSYPVFHQCLLDQMSINAVEIQDVYQPIRADIVLSNSCLEHIVNLDKVLSVLACQDIKKARQMHLVNFGNHRNKYSPFQKIYEWWQLLPFHPLVHTYWHLQSWSFPYSLDLFWAQPDLHFLT